MEQFELPHAGIFRLEPDFAARWRADQELKREWRGPELGERVYPASAGLYRKPLWRVPGDPKADAIEFGASNIEQKIQEDEEISLNGPLTGIEQSIALQIEEVLKQKEKPPVVALDFGGKFGLSFIRIAAQHEDLIKSGRLAMVATDLLSTPDMNQIDEQGYRGVARLLHKGDKKYDYYQKPDHRYTDEELDYINTHQELVHYLAADAHELMSRTITVEGSEVPLRGNVDIVHEEKVLVHTYMPDWVLVELGGGLLSRHGTMFVGTQEGYFKGNGPNHAETAESRKVALAKGRDNLRVLFPQPSSRPADDASNYFIFTRRDAPTARLFESAPYSKY